MTFFSPCGPIRRLASARNILVAADFLAPDDAAALTPAESAGFAHRTPAQRQASGAARRLARRLLAGQGAAPTDLLVDGDGAPLWPAGFCGSLAHDETSAVAAVGRGNLGVGVDVEPDAPLPEEMIELVATPAERARYDAALLQSRKIFAVKEACFKALFPFDRKFREFSDIELAFDADHKTGRARSELGGACIFALESEAKILALAFRIYA